MPPKTAEERRRSRNVVFGALITLFVIYFVKFTFPQHTVGTVITHHYTKGVSSIDGTSSDPKSAIKAGQAALSAASSGTATAPAKRPTAAASTPQIVGGYNGTIYDKVAIIIEDRPRTNLIPLILHFSTVLGPSWPIVIYTSSENVGIFASSAALGRYLRSGIVSIRILPSTVLFTNSDSVSAFLTKPWIWQNLAPAKHILMFQSDSMLCANAARSVEDFFEYDFVGAPIAPNLGAGMNGGLSLRKRETILRILDEWDWEKAKGRRFEDQWYFDRYVFHFLSIILRFARGIPNAKHILFTPMNNILARFIIGLFTPCRR